MYTPLENTQRKQIHLTLLPPVWNMKLAMASEPQKHERVRGTCSFYVLPQKIILVLCCSFLPGIFEACRLQANRLMNKRARTHLACARRSHSAAGSGSMGTYPQIRSYAWRKHETGRRNGLRLAHVHDRVHNSWMMRTSDRRPISIGDKRIQ